MLAYDDIVTLEQLEGYRTVQTFGRVSGTASRPRNRLRSTFRSLGMLIGLASTEVLTDAEQLRAEALEALRKRAESFGANAVIGVQFFVSEGEDGSCEVVVFGEAVIVQKSREA
ncbi:MAG: heavy metal-binding domain-containing protein [Candidatus Eremiobacteraeota bacterium]|nr:heavy metal-binding domain-containing protein [Candidatus Eremiobacteraeota bacterium]